MDQKMYSLGIDKGLPIPKLDFINSQWVDIFNSFQSQWE